jgi:hypothetical protein
VEKWNGKWGLAGGIFTWSSLLSYIEIIIAGLLNLRAWFIKTFWLIDQDCTVLFALWKINIELNKGNVKISFVKAPRIFLIIR